MAFRRYFAAFSGLKLSIRHLCSFIIHSLLVPSASSTLPLMARYKSSPCSGWRAPTAPPGRADHPGWHLDRASQRCFVSHTTQWYLYNHTHILNQMSIIAKYSALMDSINQPLSLELLSLAILRQQGADRLRNLFTRAEVGDARRIHCHVYCF